MYSVSSEQHRSVNGKQAPVYISQDDSSHYHWTQGANAEHRQEEIKYPQAREHHPLPGTGIASTMLLGKNSSFPSVLQAKGIWGQTMQLWDSWWPDLQHLGWCRWEGCPSSSHWRQDRAKPQKATINIATGTANTLLWVSLSALESWHLTNFDVTEGHPFSSYPCWCFYMPEISMMCIELCVWFRTSLSPQNSPLCSSLLPCSSLSC